MHFDLDFGFDCMSELNKCLGRLDPFERVILNRDLKRNILEDSG